MVPLLFPIATKKKNNNNPNSTSSFSQNPKRQTATVRNIYNFQFASLIVLVWFWWNRKEEFRELIRKDCLFRDQKNKIMKTAMD